MTIFPAASDKGTPAPAPDMIVLRRLNLFYGTFQALKDINATFPRQAITALIGPSGCGKSTLLRTLNRMNDLIEGVRITGEVRIDGVDIFGPDVVLTDLRMEKVDGMQVLEKCRATSADTEVILITGYATLESAVEAMKPPMTTTLCAASGGIVFARRA